MAALKDILNIEDIKQMVDTFYDSVKKDDLLGPIFNDKLQGRWPEHLQKMYGFWQTILFDVRAYSGTPFPPHKQLPVDKTHFDRWVILFNTSIDAQFSGVITEEAKMRATNMAFMFNHKIEYFRGLKNE
ncbi:group III truncated hemoglobin [Flavobacterium pectinovorum]|uniref:group III truncated hemoglobin n=1 Tax=Flavobacterium pectinovorum TaxID=29533 RepID=UPI001FAC8287|nr:group III truncated hemoglobin [Flavobacterium pectinovorum]MCI9843456.1 group III truncated hemoglobin [Flavobacterium pectinovorum]